MRNWQMSQAGQKGLTLIETVLVLLVAAIIIGGIWMGYSQVRQNSEIDNTMTALDETIQVTRDYLSSQAAVPGPPATNSLSPALYNGGLMPAGLSYKGPAATSVLGGINADTAIYVSPMGTDFFVQYPNGAAAPAKYFEIRIGFLDASGKVNLHKCLQLMPKIIGTLSLIQDRGLIGYWYGNVSAWNAGVTPLGGSGAAMASLTQLLPTSQTQSNNCAAAAEARLYFSMRP